MTGKVLLLDNREQRRNAIARVFCDEGYEVCQAATSPDGLKKCVSEKPDVVVVQLSQKTTLQWVRQLKSNPELGPILLIQVSAIFSRERLEGVEQAYVPDAADPRVLLAQVESLLRAHRAEALRWPPTAMPSGRPTASEVRPVEEGLRQSDERFHLVTQALNALVYDYDLITGHVQRFDGVRDLIGFNPEEVPPTEDWWFQRVYPEDLDRVQRQLRAALAEGRPILDSEYRIQHKLGNWVWISDRARIIYDSAGHPVRMVGCSSSIDARKRVETALEQSERLLHSHLENTPMAVIEWDANLVVTRWTGEAERMFGWTVAEVLNRPIADLHLTRELDVPEVRPNSVPGRRVVGATRNYTKHGRVLYCTWYNSVLLDSQGRMTSVLSLVLDETRRVEAEEALERKSEELEALLDAVPAIIWTCQDPHGKRVTGNSAANQLLGVTAATNVSQLAAAHGQAAPIPCCHQDGSPMPMEELPLIQALALGRPVTNAVIQLRMPSTQPVFLLGSAVPLFRPDGAVRGGVAAFIDITEREHLEEQLRQRVEELERLMDTVPAAIWIAQDPTCNQITGNRVANQLLEAAEGENLSPSGSLPAARTSRRYFHENQELAPEQLPMHLAAAMGKDIWNFELQASLPSGRCLSLFGSASPLRDGSGQVRGCLGAFMDITDRKAAEGALRESEARFRTMADASPVLIWATNLEGGIEFVNRAYREFFGVTAEEVIQPG